MGSHPDLHGNVPENSAAALLLIDVINDLEFEDGDKLLAAALTMGEKIAELKRRASASKIPTIYVNDNFGRWTSDFRRLVEHCQHDSVRGSPLARLLAPAEDDFFVLKPKHSGFFFTTLDLVLKHLGANNLILTGLTTDICVLFTANDAFMRGYRLWVPSTCVATVEKKHHEQALQYMQRILKADSDESSLLDLEQLNSSP